MPQKRRRRILLIIVVLLLLVFLGIPLAGGLVYAAFNNGVITTNFPFVGGTIASLPFRFFPNIGYGDYSNAETDPVAVPASERDAVLAKVQAQLPAGMSVVSLNTWSDAKENANTVQVVNNVPISGATYTIILPPQWNKSAKMPVLLSGN